jgi:CheY-like chemotaxis protein
MTGVEFLEELLNLKLDNLPKRIMTSGYSQEGEVNNAIEKGLLDIFISKPWTYDGLKEAILNA